MVDCLCFSLLSCNRKLAADLVDPIRPGSLNQSLMELGATLCTAQVCICFFCLPNPLQNPSCSNCPVQSFCHAQKEVKEYEKTSNPFKSVSNGGPNNNVDIKGCSICGEIEDGHLPTTSVTRYPTKVKKTSQREEAVAVALVEWIQNGKDSQYLLVQRPEKGKKWASYLDIFF